MHRMCLVWSQKANPSLMLGKSYTVVGELSCMDSNSDQVSLLTSGLKINDKSNEAKHFAVMKFFMGKNQLMSMILLTFTGDLVDIVVRAIGGCCCSRAEGEWISRLSLSRWVRHIIIISIIISNVISVVSECVAQSRSSFLD